MTDSPFETIWSLGYHRLCPIIPPGAPISERSNLFKRIAAGDDARGKVPGIKWQDGTWSGLDFVAHESVGHDLARWNAMGAGVGIKTGQGLALIDADTLHEDRAKIILDMITDRIGPLPIRIGRYPKAGYLVRVEGDFQYQRIEFGERDDKGRLQERVEVLYEGRQFVAHGIHPSTGQPYRWPRGIPALADIPTVHASALTALLEALRPLLPAASDLVREGAQTNVNQDTLKGDIDWIRRAVAATPNTSERFPTRESYRDFGYAIKAATVDDEAAGFEIYADWCARWTEGDNEPDVVAADWSRMKPPFRVGASMVYETAEKASGGSFHAADAIAGSWFEEIRQVEALFPEEERAPTPSDLIRATPYAFPDPAAIPPRAWLYARHYIRKFVSATVAPSGVGKSSLIIAEALVMASGKPLLGIAPQGQFRVWLWNGEDPRDELERRIAACMLHYGLTREDVGDRLFVDTGREIEIVMAVEGRDGAVISAPVADAVTRTIAENRIDVMQVDPFVSSHRISENDNGAIDMVSKRWARIADHTNCAIELVHHVRKLNGAEITVEDSRGAVSLIATSRSARALTRMTAVEGQKLGLDEVRHRLFRFGDGKNNLAPPSGEDTRWLELRSVGLGNGLLSVDGSSCAMSGVEGGDGAGALVDAAGRGDSVGVVTVYEVDRARVGAAEDEKAVALDKIRAGEWRKDIRSGDAWIGSPVAQALSLDLDDPADKARVRSLVASWIKDGTLFEVTRNDEKRRPRTYVEVSGVAHTAYEVDKESESVFA